MTDKTVTLDDVLGELYLLRQEKQRTRLARLAWRVFCFAVVAALLWVVGGVRQTTDDITEARKDGRAATCSAFDGLVGALVGAGEAPADETDRAGRQAHVDAFVVDFEMRLAPLGCDLTTPTIRQPGG